WLPCRSSASGSALRQPPGEACSPMAGTTSPRPGGWRRCRDWRSSPSSWRSTSSATGLATVTTRGRRSGRRSSIESTRQRTWSRRLPLRWLRSDPHGYLPGTPNDDQRETMTTTTVKPFPKLELEGPPRKVGFDHGRLLGDRIAVSIDHYRT